MHSNPVWRSSEKKSYFFGSYRDPVPGSRQLSFKKQVPFCSKSPVLWTFVGKISLHIHVPAAFPGRGWIKGAKTGTIYKTLGSLQKGGCNSACFGKESERIFFIRNKKRRAILGISGVVQYTGRGKSVIWAYLSCDPDFGFQVYLLQRNK